MSATLVTSGGFRDLFMKHQEPKTHFKSILVDTSNRKAVGAQLGFSVRRNSGSPVTLSMNLTNKNNTSSICLSEANIICNNHLQQQQQLSSSTTGHRKLDRSMSEPVERRGSNSGNTLTTQEQRACNQGGNSSRYKTELCRPFEENGTCKYGDKCQFAHGGHELRTLARHPKYKTELCRTFHTNGFCPYGPRCHFIHNEEESRKSNGNGSPPPMSGRPKALSIGGYSSLDSPPSSLSESPTSAGSFFGANDDPFVNNAHHALVSYTSNSTPATPTTANNAFKYSQDFTTVFNNYNNHIFNQQYTLKMLSKQQMNLNDSTDAVFRVPSPPPPILCPTVMEAPSSPDSSSSSSSSSSSDDDSLSPTGSPTCTSPLDVSKNLRLPIFSQLSISDD